KQKNLDTICHTLKRASEQESHLVVFPELFLTGYLIGPNLKELAETNEGPSIEAIRNVCQQYKINTAFGMAEKTADNSYYIVSVFIDHFGNVKETYKKAHLFDHESKYFTRGNESVVIDTPLGKVGLMICFDVEFPELARALKLKGAEFIVIINANMHPYKTYHHIYAKSRAMENQIPVIIVNRVGEEEGMIFCGDSMVIDLDGDVLLRLGEDEEVRATRFSTNKTGDDKLNYLARRNESAYTIT